MQDQVHQMCMITKLGDVVNNEFSSSRPVSPKLDKINDHVKQFILGPKCLEMGDQLQSPRQHRIVREDDPSSRLAGTQGKMR